MENEDYSKRLNDLLETFTKYREQVRQSYQMMLVALETGQIDVVRAHLSESLSGDASDISQIN